MRARTARESSKTAYEKCLVQNPTDHSKYEPLKTKYEADLKAYREASERAGPVATGFIEVEPRDCRHWMKSYDWDEPMSKYMQLTVTVNPYYQKDLADNYLNLARSLKALDPDLLERNPSLYELAGQIDKLLYKFDGTPVREVLLRHRENLSNLHKSIEENIADWNLAQADQLLYEMEDIFDKIESELG